MYDRLVNNVNNVDTSGFVLRTKYETGKSDLGSKISDVDRKIKIPDVCNSVKKTDYDTKISEIEKKFTNHNHDKFLKLTAEKFAARLINLLHKQI